MPRRTSLLRHSIASMRCRRLAVGIILRSVNHKRIGMMSIRRRSLLSLMVLLSLCPWLGGARCAFEWNASVGATGYELSYGEVSGHYEAVVDVGAFTRVVINGLQPRIPYYVTVA